MPRIIGHRIDSNDILMVLTDDNDWCRICDIVNMEATPRIRVEDAVISASWIYMNNDPELLKKALKCKEPKQQNAAA